MTTLLTLLLVIHGAVHLVGVAKAFGRLGGDALSLPVSQPVGSLWLIVALLFLVSAGLRLAAPERWWIVALPALVLSQVLIVGAWSDAKAGTLVNLLIAVPLVVTVVNQRPSSLSSQFHRDVATCRPAGDVPVVTAADLAPLPAPLRRYLERTGCVGQPRVATLRARFRGHLRNGNTGPWMAVGVEQVSDLTVPARYFFLRAALYGLPVIGYHRYAAGTATMDIRAFGLVPVVTSRGAAMDQSETVTYVNDLCLLAPAALLDADVVWQPRDAHTVAGRFTVAGRTVSAVLTFDEQGDLETFTSGDRFQSADGKTHRQLPWSTPVRRYGQFGPLRLPVEVDAVWQNPDGPFPYARFTLVDLAYDVAGGPPDR